MAPEEAGELGMLAVCVGAGVEGLNPPEADDDGILGVLTDGAALGVDGLNPPVEAGALETDGLNPPEAGVLLTLGVGLDRPHPEPLDELGRNPPLLPPLEPAKA